MLLVLYIEIHSQLEKDSPEKEVNQRRIIALSWTFLYSINLLHLN